MKKYLFGLAAFLLSASLHGACLEVVLPSPERPNEGRPQGEKKTEGLPPSDLPKELSSQDNKPDEPALVESSHPEAQPTEQEERKPDESPLPDSSSTEEPAPLPERLPPELPVRPEPCQRGTTRCGSRCVDTLSDPNHCGNCTTVCRCAEFCVASSCSRTCVNCSGVCHRDDPENCGSCGYRCAKGEICQCETCVPAP